MKVTHTALPFLFTLLATATLLLTLPNQNLLAQCDTAGTTFAGGTGIEGDPFQISTIEHLNNIRDNSGGCNYLEKHFVLTKDLDFEDTDSSGTAYVYPDDDLGTAAVNEGWKPIGHDTDKNTVGNQGTAFTGSFDGGGYVIHNLSISRSDEDHVGLFGEVGAGGVVKNLGLENLDVSGRNNTGGLVGTTRHTDSTISSCYTAGSVSGGGNTGGLAGENAGPITLCYSSARVTGRANSGGLVGNARSIFSSSYSVGDVTGTGQVGGFAGAVSGQIRSCYSTGSVTGTLFKVGGFVGIASGKGTTLTSCYSTGNATGNITVGGFVGEALSVSITSCYSTGTATATSGTQEGGFVGSNIDSTYENTYWENAGTAIDDATDDTDRTSAQMKALTLANLGDDTMELSWDVGTANQYPALRTYKVNDSDVQVQGDVIAGQPCPRVGCPFGGGTGTEDDPYQISTIAHLNNIRGGYLDDHFILMNDLDFDGYEYSTDVAKNAKGWLPIGHNTGISTFHEGTKFTGTFDGGNNVISNLSITRTSEGVVGLFGSIAGTGSIKDLGLEDVTVSGKGAAGTLAGDNHGSVSGCHSSGDVVITAAGIAGGLVGVNIRGMVTDCYAAVNVSTPMGGNYIGGLIGEDRAGSITRCYATGNLDSEGVAIGGLIGYLGEGTVASCYATGSIGGSGASHGGLVGQGGDGGSITSSYSTGAVSGGSNVGGLVGELEGTITLSYWDTQTSGTTSARGSGATGKDTDGMKALTTGAFGTNDSDWDFGDNTQYPALKKGGTTTEAGQPCPRVECGPLVSIVAGTSPVTEGTAAEFTLTRTGDTTAALTVMVIVTQTGDFLTSTTSPVAVEILADQTTKTLTVNTDDDVLDEDDGEITATIAASASTYRLGTFTTMVAVMDNDVVPPAPADLTASTTDTTSVILTWTAVVADPLVTGYQVKVSSAAIGATGVTTGWMEITGSTVATVSHTVTGLTALTAYTFAIRAQNAAGDGEPATIDATTAAELPGVPTALMVGTPTSTTVPLTWTVATTGGDATGFQFKVSSVATGATGVTTGWMEITGSTVATVSHTVTGLTALTAYTFAIRAQNAAGDGEPATIDATTAAAPTTPPAVPSGLLAPPAETTSNSVGLTWTAAATDAAISAYQVKVSSVATGATGVMDWMDIMNSDVMTASHTVTGLTAETAYTFAIRAQNPAGDGDAATIDATTTAVELPGAPTALTAGTPTSTTVPLTWTVATTGGDATAFQFKVSNADGSEIITDWTDIMNSDAMTERYTVTGLTGETMYTFAIHAKNSAGVSDEVTETATTAAAPTSPPDAPSGLLAPAAETTSTSVGLTWTAAATDADISAYQVKVSSVATGATGVTTGWMDIAVSSVATTSHTVTGLTAETAYTFAIRAKNTAGESDEVTVTATTKAASATLSFGGETIDDQTYTKDTAITDLVLPVATGGMEPYTYTLEPVPAGLEFNDDPASRTLSGMPTMVADPATTHTYTVTDSTTLTKTLTFTITVNAVVEPTLGIGSTEAAVHVYPNPAGDVLYIEFPGAGDYGIALLTVTGQQVFGGQHAGGGTKKMDVSTLKGGVYFLKIEDSEGGYHTVRILL